MNRRTSLGLGILIGLLIAAGVGLWWSQEPSEEQVRRTVITTVQEEAPASFLVTGTLDISVRVRLDSSEYLTPDWMTHVLSYAQPAALPLLQGTSRTDIQVPGRVSYGFNVQALSPRMIAIEEGNVVVVDLPALSVHSVEPDLARLRVRSQTQGWMRVFPSDVYEEVRTKALGRVQEAFRTQAQRHLASATQPSVNTARALKAMLTPPLKATGLEAPQFRIWVGDRLSLVPKENDGQNFQN
ncbi:DUF4230 domain-containing protein [Salinibacter sp. 10B]|uniref:DUF4230 domain-containing protein n=1 Tax=Salinibacter sp. 10B TaxID=1923971 RepID=UPI000CF55DBC|nr:DUF4230 domain-containing protein [Salinibacter sp. 10B]